MSSLTCSEFDALLIEQTAERNFADERLPAHAAGCIRCADVLNEEHAIDSAIAAWKASVPEADLVDRVLAGWRKERTTVVTPQRNDPQRYDPRREKPAAQGTRHYSLLAVVVAAGLILAVSLFSRNGNQSPREFVNTAGNPNPSVATTGQPAGSLVENPLEVDQLVAGMKTRYSGAAQRMTRIVGGWNMEWPALADVDVNILPQRPATAPRPGPRKPTGGDLGDTLKPIGRDVRKAFSFLRDAVPGLDGSTI